MKSKIKKTVLAGGLILGAILLASSSGSTQEGQFVGGGQGNFTDVSKPDQPLTPASPLNVFVEAMNIPSYDDGGSSSSKKPAPVMIENNDLLSLGGTSTVSRDINTEKAVAEVTETKKQSATLSGQLFNKYSISNIVRSTAPTVKEKYSFIQPTSSAPTSSTNDTKKKEKSNGDTK